MEQSTIAIIIIVIAIISFILEKIPMAMTATLAALAMGVFGIIDITSVYKNFGSTSVVMIASMMIVGDSVFECGLANVMGKKLTSLGLGKNQKLLIIVMVVFASIASAFFSNSAVIAMLIPLLASIVVESNGTVQNKYVLMAAGMSASAGGFCTLAGSTPQMVTQEILIQQGMQPMGFFELAKAGIPIAIMMIIYFATIGYSMEKRVFTFEDVIPGLECTEQEPSKGQVPQWKMYLTGLILLLCVTGFITGIWNLAIVALMGVCALTVTGCIEIKKALRNVDWNTIVIIAMAQGFAQGLDVSGASTLIADYMLKVFGGVNASPYVVLTVLMIVTFVLTNFMSNIAVISMILPIGFSSAMTLGVRPETFAIALTIGCMLATATPVGTPCVTQTLVGGYRYMDYVKIGLPITLAQVIVCILLVPVVYGF